MSNETIAMPVASIPPLPGRPTRLMSLDILRGLAILMMIVSGTFPKTLPSWMDHGYQPHFKPDPATGMWKSALDAGGDAVFDGRWKAFTWVDLVFPMFLFAMGAAIPLTVGVRLARGDSRLGMIPGIVGRWLMLLFFAVLIERTGAGSFRLASNVAPWASKMLGLAALFPVFMFFVRWPKTVPAAVQRAIRIGSLLTIAALVITFEVRPDKPFTWAADTIICVLANCYLVAALATALIPGPAWVRFVVLLPLMFVAHYSAIDPSTHPDWLWLNQWPKLNDALAAFAHSGRALNLPTWVPGLGEFAKTHPETGSLLSFSPLWNATWYKYLWIVMPGALVGDQLRIWSRRSTLPDTAPITEEAETLWHRWLPLMMTLLVCAAVFAGLRHYGYPLAGWGGPLKTPWLAPLLAVPLMVGLIVVTLPGARGDRAIERWLLHFGTSFLLVGLLLCCLKLRGSDGTIFGGVFFEGGISKGPPATLSYYTTSVGLCALLLMGLMRAFDLRRSDGVPGIVGANGQNPLLAYYLGHAVIGAVFGLAIFDTMGHFFGASFHDRFHTLGDLLGDQRTDHRWMQACGGVAKTGLLAVFVWGVTRLRIYWRA